MWHFQHAVTRARLAVPNDEGAEMFRTLSITGPGWWRLVEVSVEPWPAESKQDRQPPLSPVSPHHRDLGRPATTEENR